MKETVAMILFFSLSVSVAGDKYEDRKRATHTTGDPSVFLLQLFSVFFRDMSDDPSTSALFPSNCCLILALLVIIMLMKHGWVVYKRTYWSRRVKHSSFHSASDNFFKKIRRYPWITGRWFEFGVGLTLKRPMLCLPPAALLSYAFLCNWHAFSGTIREKKVNCSQTLGLLSSRHLPRQRGW